MTCPYENGERMSVTPTIIIGLGGTGYEAVIRLKKKFIDTFSKPVPVVRFLVFDTDVSADTPLQQTDETRIKTDDTDKSEKYELTSAEYRHLTVENVGGILRNLEYHPQIASWFPADLNPGQIKTGANQIRAVGRLALFWNIKEISDSIDKASREVCSIRSKTELIEEGIDVLDGLNVYVISSLCGGSGSGMFIDIAYLTRAIVNEAELSGILVMPGAFNIDQQASIEANTYAALKELDHFMDMASFKCSYGKGVADVEIYDKPFDRCYLIDSWSEDNKNIEDRENVCAMIAETVFLEIASILGKSHRSVVDNIKYKLSSKVNGKITAYSSFGTSSIIFPVGRVLRACSYKFGETLLDHILTFYDKDKAEKEVRNYLMFEKLNEEFTDDVINALRSDGQRFIAYRKTPSDFDGFSIQLWASEISKWANTLLNSILPRDLKVMEQIAERFYEEKLNSLREKVAQLINDSEFGLQLTAKFLILLEAQFNAFIEILSKEIHKNFKEHLRYVKPDIQKRQLADLCDSFWSRTFGKDKILEIRKRYIEDVLTRLNYSIEIKARELAISIYTKLNKEISRLRTEKIDPLIGTVTRLLTDFSKGRAQNFNPRSSMTFILEKHIYAEQEDIMELYNEFCPEFKNALLSMFVQVGNLYKWESYDYETLKEKVLNFCVSCFEKITERGVIDILKDKGVLATRLEDVINSATPFWRYTEVEIPGGGDFAEIFIISVEDKYKAEVKRYIKDESKVTFATTRNKFRISVVRFKHGLPLFALSAVRRDYKTAYDLYMKRGELNRSKPLHLSPAFEKFEEPVLLRKSEEETQIDASEQSSN